MSKYIVKNCPSAKGYNVFGIDTDYCCYDKHDYCKNITDCFIKQVIDKCSVYTNEDICLDCKDFETAAHCWECDYEHHRCEILEGRANVSVVKEILDMFDIEEVKE